MTRRLAWVALAAAALVAAPPGHAAARGPELVSTATIEPGPHLFGDRVNVELGVVVDPRRVDPDAVSVDTGFEPYIAVGSVDRARRSAGDDVRLSYRYSLECLSDTCLAPVGKAEHRITLPHAIVHYRTRKGARHTIAVRWPRFRLVARFMISPDLSTETEIRSRLSFQNDPIVGLFARTRPPDPSYHLSPSLLAALLFAAALACLAGAAVASRPLLASLAARRRRREDRTTPLERALQLVEGASRRNPGSPEHREALARLARELRHAGLRDLVAQARRLAWSEGTPSRSDADALTKRVRAELEATA